MSPATAVGAVAVSVAFVPFRIFLYMSVAVVSGDFCTGGEGSVGLFFSVNMRRYRSDGAVLGEGGVALVILVLSPRSFSALRYMSEGRDFCAGGILSPLSELRNCGHCTTAFSSFSTGVTVRNATPKGEDNWVFSSPRTEGVDMSIVVEATTGVTTFLASAIPWTLSLVAIFSIKDLTVLLELEDVKSPLWLLLSLLL